MSNDATVPEFIVRVDGDTVVELGEGYLLKVPAGGTIPVAYVDLPRRPARRQHGTDGTQHKPTAKKKPKKAAAKAVVSSLEYRISHRRMSWAPTTSDQTRTFKSPVRAQRFLDKLHALDRPELSPVITQTHMRQVSTWERIESLPTNKTGTRKWPYRTSDIPA